MLKPTYENKTDIPEGLEKFYSETAGKFILQVEGIESVENVKTTIDKLKANERKAQDEAKTLKDKFGLLPDEFNIEEYNRLKDANRGEDINQKLTEQRERLEAQHQRELAARDKIIQEKDGVIQVNVKDIALKTAIADHKIAPQYMKAVESMMRDRIKLDGNDVLLDDRPFKEGFKSWVESEDGQHFSSALNNSGGDANKAKPAEKGSSKTITREQFDALDNNSRMSEIKSGTKVTD